MIERTKKDCKLLGTEICAYAGCEGCEKCFVSDRAYKKADMEEINESWKITLSYLPENVDELHTSDKCWLCKGGERRDASCFAVLDLGHPEPEYKKGMFFGFGKKVRAQIGSLLSLPIACCSKCRNRFRMMEAIRWGTMLVLAVLSIVLMAIPAISQALTSITWAMPLLVFLIAIVGGYYAGIGLAKVYVHKTEGKTEYDLLQLPIVSRMVWLGWFPIQRDKGKARVGFMGKKTREHLQFRGENVDVPVHSEPYQPGATES